MPTREELLKAISQLSSGKVPGSDSIPAEIYKNGGPALVLRILQLFRFVWQQETLPQDLKDASNIHLYKRKGNRQDCNNHRGISLLSIAGKILARILNRLVKHLKQVVLGTGLQEQQALLPGSQCGFRKEGGTIDMVFAARQLQEKCQEQNVDLYSTYVYRCLLYTAHLPALRLLSWMSSAAIYGSLVDCSGMLLIVGDINIHVDDPQDSYGVNFKDLLYRLNLQQHVEDATHEKAHTLDLVITREGNGLVSDLFIHAPTFESDHFPVTCKLKIKKAECQRKIVSYRKTKDKYFPSTRGKQQSSGNE